jgi:hypothetical protein
MRKINSALWNYLKIKISDCMNLHVSQVHFLGLLIISATWPLYWKKLVLKKKLGCYFLNLGIFLLWRIIFILRKGRAVEDVFSLRNKEIRAKQKLYTCCIHLELLVRKYRGIPWPLSTHQNKSEHKITVVSFLVKTSQKHFKTLGDV